MLKEDHKTVDDRFKRYEEAGDGVVEKLQVRARVVKELCLHAYIEEEVFYPATKQARRETEDMVEEAYEEHANVKQAVGRLTALEPDDPQFDSVMRQIIEDVRYHVEEEENEMFPKINEAMSSQDLSDLGDRLEESRAPESAA